MAVSVAPAAEAGSSAPLGTVEERLVRQLRALSAEQQRQLLDFADFLASRSEQPSTRTGFIGMFADRTLAEAQKRQVLDFVEFLAQKERALDSGSGLWADRGVLIGDEEIAEACREMWGNFPREDIL